MSKGTLKQNKIFGGLKPPTEDERDLQLGAIITLPKLNEIPDEFTVAEVSRIKDQGETDLCTCFAGSYASEVQEDIELSPEYQFAKTKEISGNIAEWGADMRDMLKSLCEGSLEARLVPDGLKLNLDGSNRDFIADIKNWPESLKFESKKHKKKSFFKITGPYDNFDNIRATMWKFRAERRVTITGAVWKHAWTVAPDAIIPNGEYSGGFGHAFIFNKTRIVNGKLMLVATLSNGLNFGDCGRYYFSREVVNNYFPYGAYTLLDMSKEEARELMLHNWDMKYLWLAKVVLNIKKLLNL